LLTRLRFTPFGQGLPPSGQWREGFAITDMNGDGHPDIVSGPPRKAPGAGPVIFLGNGKGSCRDGARRNVLRSVSRHNLYNVRQFPEKLIPLTILNAVEGTTLLSDKDRRDDRR